MSSTTDKFRELFKRKLILGATVGAALFFMIVGVIFWGGFNTAMEATNTLDFCISCHEMNDNVYQEYNKTIHYANRSGVRATCSDCHVPRDWTHKVIRKIQASGEVFHKVMGSVDTQEKFNEKRLTLAKRVWSTMKSTDSRECRNCHDFGSMYPENQKPRARKQHINAMENGNTCIDCHKGIAHNKVHDKLTDEEIEKLEKPNPEMIRPMPPQWKAYIEAEEQGKTESQATAADTATEVPDSAPESTETTIASAEPAASAPIAATTGSDSSGVNWDKASSTSLTLFYPGQASMEWVLNGRDHGGARPVKAGDRCFDCHAEETKDMGKKIVSGEKAEATPIPGKRGSIPVTVQATHDSENLYLRFIWEDTKHAPVPFAENGKMDPNNPSKIAMMVATDDVEYAGQAGCWVTCHNDMRDMPDAPPAATVAGNPHSGKYTWSNGITKYIPESRTEIEIKGSNDKPRGGWDKLKEDGELQAELDAGHYLDILRFKIGEGASEDGHVLTDREMNGGQGVTFTGGLVNGKWSVVMKRKLASDKPGDLSLSTDQLYNIGFAIHDDYSNGRFHHVSLGYKLGFDNDEAEINAIAQ